MSDRSRPGVERQSDDRLYTIGDLRNAMEYVAALIPRLRTQSAELEALNLGMDIEWGLRQKLRTLEGAIDKAIEHADDFLDGVATDDAMDELRELYPDIYTDEG